MPPAFSAGEHLSDERLGASAAGCADAADGDTEIVVLRHGVLDCKVVGYGDIVSIFPSVEALSLASLSSRWC